MGIWSRKTIDICRKEGTSRLRRSVGVAGLTAFGVGCTIGAGIFSLTGNVAAHQAGPAVSLAFLLASVACFFAGLCYAEFAALVPISGSAYSYAYITFGELVAWIVGWSLMLEWLLSASVVAISWSGYVTGALKDIGVRLPPLFTTSPLTVDFHGRLAVTGAWLDLPAVVVVVACTLLLLVGTRTSTVVNVVIVLAKVLALIAFVAVGVHYVRPEHWHPFIPPNSGQFGQFGWSGIAQGAGTLFFAYLGFDGVSTLAEEAHDPQHTLPWSLFASLLICTMLYVGVGLVVTGLADYRSLDVTDPLYYAVSGLHISRAPIQTLIAVVAIVGLISVVLTCIAGQVRIFYSMSCDGLLPPALGRLSRSQRTPYVATLVTGGIAAVMAGAVPLGVLDELVSMGTLLAFSIVCIGVTVLRRIAPDVNRPFRTPWVPVVPAMGVLSCSALMLSLPTNTWIRLAMWTAVGLLVYAAYGYRHSKLNGSARRSCGHAVSQSSQS